MKLPARLFPPRMPECYGCDFYNSGGSDRRRNIQGALIITLAGNAFSFNNPIEDYAMQYAKSERLRLDVPYEPSPLEVIDEMIRLAGITRNDTVYDLGCGDGRIVLAAAQKTGCTAVGIDLDPRRIKESKENALREGLSGKVSFYEQCLFDSDLSKATVVMLFLYPDVNIKLRDKLLNELNPGTRVVSHSHTMGDWVPDKSTRANWRNLYFWVIPARVEGKWEWESDLGNGPEKFTMELARSYQRFSGNVKSDQEKKGIKKGRLNGEKITFNTGNSKTEMHFEGIVKEDCITGAIRKDSGEAISWTAVRKPEENRRALLKLLGIY